MSISSESSESSESSNSDKIECYLCEKYKNRNEINNCETFFVYDYNELHWEVVNVCDNCCGRDRYYHCVNFVEDHLNEAYSSIYFCSRCFEGMCSSCVKYSRKGLCLKCFFSEWDRDNKENGKE